MFGQGMMLGGGGPQPRVQITDRSIIDFLAGTSQAKYNVRGTGVARYFREMDGSYTNISGEWLLVGAVADYQVRATLISGAQPNQSFGSFGAWQNAENSIEWSISSTSTLTGVILVEIRDDVTLEVLDSAQITLEANGGL